MVRVVIKIRIVRIIVALKAGLYIHICTYIHIYYRHYIWSIQGLCTDVIPSFPTNRCKELTSSFESRADHRIRPCRYNTPHQGFSLKFQGLGFKRAIGKCVSLKWKMETTTMGFIGTTKHFKFYALKKYSGHSRAVQGSCYGMRRVRGLRFGVCSEQRYLPSP